MFFLAPLREVECEGEYPVDAYAGHYGLLKDHFAVGSGKYAAADRRVLAFGVFADDEEVDVARSSACERAGYSGHQANGTEVDVLVELATEEDQRAPERDVIGNLVRPPDGSEEDDVTVSNPVCRVGRQAPV